MSVSAAMASASPPGLTPRLIVTVVPPPGVSPSTISAPIAWATYAGHRYAEELDAPDIGDKVPFRREVVGLAPR